MTSPGDRRRRLSADVAVHARVDGPPQIEPRLMNLRQAASYLGVSYWTARDWALQELFLVVRLPALRPREGDRERDSLRRVLIDVRDLDAFVDRLKAGSAPDVESRARRNEAGNNESDSTDCARTVPVRGIP